MSQKSTNAAIYAKRIALPNLSSGERLIKCFIGKEHVQEVKKVIFGPIPELIGFWYCLALTQTGVVLMKLDALMKCADTLRIPFEDIQMVQIKNGLTRDRFIMNFANHNPLDLDVVIAYRDQTRAVLYVLNSRQSNQ